MTDEFEGPRPLGEDDPAGLEAVQQALRSLTFLRPDGASEDDRASGETTPSETTPSEPMPDWAWDRLTAALAAEAGTRGRRPSRLTRWAGGLVAASVAVLAVGVAVTAFQGGQDGDAVVAEGASSDLLAESATSTMSAPEPSGPSARLGAAPEQLTFAGMVPPVLRLVDSDTDYTSTGLGRQVERVLARFGMAPAAIESKDLLQAPTTVAMPMGASNGFLSSPERLRDCITRLTEVADSTALMVDMATFDGRAAGVVVAPEYAATSEPTMAELEVWVVDPECERPLRAIRIEVAASGE